MFQFEDSFYFDLVEFSVCVNAADYLGSILSYVAIAVPIFAGRYDGLSSGDLGMLIGQV